MIHLEIFFACVYRVKEISRLIFLYMNVPVPFVEKTAFHIELPWHFCQKSICHIYVGLILDSLLCSFYLYVSSYASITLSFDLL